MNIEEYLNKNRQQLDVNEPDVNGIWQGIEQKRHHKKSIRIRAVQWSAAAIFLLLLTGVLIRHEMVTQRQIRSLSQINKELANKEKQYQQQVSLKWNEYQSMKGADSPLKPELIEELKYLDTIYNKGLDDLKENGYNDRAVIILLETYEKRLRLIEQLIYEKQKQRNYENKNRQVQL